MILSRPFASPHHLATLYVRGFGLLGLGVATAFGFGAWVTRETNQIYWAVFGLVLALGSLFQTWRGRADAGRFVAVASLAIVPLGLFGSGGQFPAMIAVGSLMAVAIVLVESDRRRTVVRLLIVYLAVAAATLLNARAADHPGRVVGAVIGVAVLALAFVVTYLLFVASARVAQYDRQLHSALFDSAGDGVVVVDAEGTIVRANSSAEKTFGYGSGDMVGRSVSELLPPAYRERHERFVAATMEGAADTRAMSNRPILHALRSWGETFPAEISVATFDVLGGRMAAATVRDISRRVAAETAARERLESFRLLYERVPVGLYRSAPDGRILGGNPAFVTLLGADDEEDLLGRLAQDFYVDPTERDRLLEETGTGGASAVYQIRALDGRVLWVRDHTRAVLADDGTVVAYEGALEDITAQVEAVAALEASNRSKERLIAAVAHNLRTPLTVILGYAELLNRSDITADPTELAQTIRDHAHELAALIDELLIASRLQGDGGAFEVVNVDGVKVDEAVAEALRNLGFGAGHPRVDVACDGRTVYADPLRLRQAVQLMMSVALRDTTGRISVEAEGDEDGSEVRLVVSYEGQPVSAQDCSQLFHPFSSSQADSTNPNRLGVGLWAARKLASAMDGDAGYEYRDGRRCYVLRLSRRCQASRGRSPVNTPDAGSEAFAD